MRTNAALVALSPQCVDSITSFDRYFTPVHVCPFCWAECGFSPRSASAPALPTLADFTAVMQDNAAAIHAVDAGIAAAGAANAPAVDFPTHVSDCARKWTVSLFDTKMKAAAEGLRAMFALGTKFREDLAGLTARAAETAKLKDAARAAELARRRPRESSPSLFPRLAAAGQAAPAAEVKRQTRGRRGRRNKATSGDAAAPAPSPANAPAPAPATQPPVQVEDAAHQQPADAGGAAKAAGGAGKVLPAKEASTTAAAVTPKPAAQNGDAAQEQSTQKQRRHAPAPAAPATTGDAPDAAAEPAAAASPAATAARSSLAC
jgi:hypothetical protein